MKIQIDPTIGEKGVWAEGIQRANSILELVLGQKAANLVTADWCLTTDEQKRPVLRLKLADFTVAVARNFSPDELVDAERLWFRLNRLWGDLLQLRSHQQLEEIQKSLEALKED